MRTTHLTFVSAAAMTISAALVYWITPSGGVASVARADVELAPAAMLEPDSDWFRTEAGSGAPVPTAVPTVVVTSEPVAIAAPAQTALPAPTSEPAAMAAPVQTPMAFTPSTGKSWKPVRQTRRSELAFAPPPPTARPVKQAAAKPPFFEPPPQQAAFPQQPAFSQPAFPQQAAFPASTAAPMGTSRASR